jgi:hypothetical protein
LQHDLVVVTRNIDDLERHGARCFILGTEQGQRKKRRLMLNVSRSAVPRVIIRVDLHVVPQERFGRQVTSFCSVISPS